MLPAAAATPWSRAAVHPARGRSRDRSAPEREKRGRENFPLLYKDCNGIAERLIEEVVRRSRDLGVATLHLHTTDMMAAAVKLYERLGFARAVEKDFFNGETHVKSYWLRLDEARVG